MRHVRGVLFVDYVRMLRAQRAASLDVHLAPEDRHFLASRIDPDAWYPMESFERMGNAILSLVTAGNLEPVRMWGRISAVQLRSRYPTLIAPNDPLETLNRFRVLRQTFFDFDALEVTMLVDGEALVVIRYHMGMPAEEAASYQSMGFFESLVQLAGGTEITARFRKRSWAGDPQTLLELVWTSPRR